MRIIALFTCLLTILSAPLSIGASGAPPEVVSNLDLKQYTGLWYEIAKIPNRFQKQCVKDTTAEYRLREDGRIDVVNSCMTASGERDEALGIARVVDKANDAKLEVSFVELLGWNLFWGDYWVLDLGEDYAYSVVGTPDRRYGWILSRTPMLEEKTLEHIRAVLRRNGYDPDDFQPTEQTLVSVDGNQ